ncbi:MAG: metallophosphoesterase family protein, partial [Promethearchaeota archaeon]
MFFTVLLDKDDDWSNINSFETAPNNTNTEFKFAIYSDSQQFFGIGWHNRICQAIASEKDLRFVAIAGDLCQNWNYKPDWNQFFYEAAIYTKNTPMVPCIGNHDGYYPEDDPDNEKHYYIKYFGFPYGENNKTLYYSFNWSNTQFIISEISKTGDEDPNNPRNIKHDRWLNKTLAKGQDKAFRILIFHRQVFSAEENNDILINRITPIVEKYNISLVLYGHHHHYERFQ